MDSKFCEYCIAGCWIFLYSYNILKFCSGLWLSFIPKNNLIFSGLAFKLCRSNIWSRANGFSATKAKHFWIVYLMFCELWGSPPWLVETGTTPGPAWALNMAPSNPLRWFYPQTWLVFSHENSHRYQDEESRRTLCRSLELSFCAAFFSVVPRPENSGEVILPPQQHFLNSESPPGSTWVPPPHTMTSQPSQVSKVGQP